MLLGVQRDPFFNHAGYRRALRAASTYHSLVDPAFSRRGRALMLQVNKGVSDALTDHPGRPYRARAREWYVSEVMKRAKKSCAPASHSGSGYYSRRPPGRGRRRGKVSFERVLNQPGGRAYLTAQYFRGRPRGTRRPWWALRDPRDVHDEEMTSIQQSNPATANAITEATAHAIGTAFMAGSASVRPRPLLEEGEEEVGPDVTRRRLNPNF
jgi:hypothetical protein